MRRTPYRQGTVTKATRNEILARTSNGCFGQPIEVAEGQYYRRVALALVISLSSCTTDGNKAASPVDTAQQAVPQQDTSALADSALRNSIEMSVNSDTDSAVEVVRRYYSEINNRDFARAYREWGDNGPPGNKTLGEFAAGFDSTASVRLTVGNVGRIEGAAGSRYLTVPVTLDAIDRANHKSVYTGEYVVRKSVVDGASPAQARWHIYSATLSRH